MKVQKSTVNERVNEPTNERTNKRTNERKNDIIKAFVWKRTTKYVEKVQRKSAETAIFLENRTWPCFEHYAKTHLWAKIKTLMTKSWGNAKKLVFPAHLAETHFRHYRFPSVCKFHEKIFSTGLEIQVIPFFSDVLAIFRKFWLQKSV